LDCDREHVRVGTYDARGDSSVTCGKVVGTVKGEGVSDTFKEFRMVLDKFVSTTLALLAWLKTEGDGAFEG
jgi:hypothetical protein